MGWAEDIARMIRMRDEYKFLYEIKKKRKTLRRHGLRFEDKMGRYELDLFGSG